jgi:hypothetical protein
MKLNEVKSVGPVEVLYSEKSLGSKEYDIFLAKWVNPRTDRQALLTLHAKPGTKEFDQSNLISIDSALVSNEVRKKWGELREPLDKHNREL